tara:strand:- start:134 stop:913 length:780 start_codon:yes stop_codon:yes gene_type:complete
MCKVSIILPVLNEEKNIEKCIKNIISQSFSDWELIIINDGSTDKTVEIIKYFSKQDDRIKLIDNYDHQGIIHCLNQGWRASGSKIICRMDADDYSSKYRLEKQFNFLKQNPEIDLVGTSVRFTLKSNNEINFEFYPPAKHNDICKNIYKVNPFIHSSIMMRKNFLERNNGYKFIGNKNIEDYYLWIRGHKNSIYENMQECLMDINMRDAPKWKEIYNRTIGHIKILIEEKTLIINIFSVIRNLLSMVLIKLKLRKLYKV